MLREWKNCLWWCATHKLIFLVSHSRCPELNTLYYDCADTGELSGNVEIALTDFFIHWEPSNPFKLEMEYHMNLLKGQGVQKAKNWNPDTWPPFIMSVTIGKHDKWRPSIESQRRPPLQIFASASESPIVRCRQNLMTQNLDPVSVTCTPRGLSWFAGLGRDEWSNAFLHAWNVGPCIE